MIDLNTIFITSDPNDNFLLNEAMNNINIFEEFIKHYRRKFIDVLVKDLFKIAALVIKTKKQLSQNETFFLGLNLLLMHQETGLDNKDKVCDVLNDFSGQSDIDKIIKMWPIASKFIPAKVDEKKLSFLSLDCLNEFDKLNGTDHYDMCRAMFKNFTQCLIKADGKVLKEEIKIEQSINQEIYRKRTTSETALKFLSKIISTKEEKKEEKEEKTTQEETYNEVMKEIKNLVGLDNIKKGIDTLINLIKVNQIRKERNLPSTSFTLHSVFYGPPGTGKTTIARLLGKVFKSLGILKHGHVVETDRAGLVAGFVGQTAQITQTKIEEALDGILFIDEAYALKPAHGGNDFGQEAIDTILKRMEDNRDKLVVIAAGYPDEMKLFIESNPGLKSRFSRYFYFKDYEPEELLLIFKKFCKTSLLITTKEADDYLLAHFQKLYKSKDRSFGNGRMVRNVFEGTLEKQANRLVNISPITNKILSTITEADIPEVDLFQL